MTGRTSPSMSSFGLPMQKPKRALVLGKFLPLHRGHIHLLETARQNSDQLTIVVCSLTSEPIPGEIRFRWMRQAFPDCRVVHLSDDSMPQEPKDHPDFWNIWKKALKKLHPEPIDLVFSSEEYGFKLAEVLDAKHHLVDLERGTVPVSGTKVRTSPFDYWDFIPEHVRGYFVKRALITGSESCGKSTMTEKLATHFNTIGVQEYARDYLKNMNFNMKDLDQIAFMQYKLQQEAYPKANKVCFSDTGAIETYIYANHYLGSSSPMIDKYLALQKDNYDLVLLLTPDVEWVSDGLRNLDKVRWEMHEKYVKLLERLGISYTLISGTDYQERTERAIVAVNSLLRGEK
jgi:HTH-type transcriptional regulator, transcriptional repressor of NAD biosynthesis genes